MMVASEKAILTGTGDPRLSVWKRIRPAGAVVLAAMMVTGAWAQGQDDRTKGPDAKSQEEKQKENAGVPVPPETTSVTKHDITVAGQLIHYTATAGNLLIRDDQDHPNASLFMRRLHAGWSGCEVPPGDVFL